MDLSEQNQLATPTMMRGREIIVPLKYLYRDPLNVRKKRPSGTRDSLAASIFTSGLLQNLIVRAQLKGKKEKTPTGYFGVVGGGLRLEALELLFTQGKIQADYPVRCLEIAQEDVVSASLAENLNREPLHGADLFDAFQAMADLGSSVAQIADAWHLTPLAVERRLKLAKISPRLMALYREDGITLDQLTALTLTDDHATQDALWFHSPEHERTPYALRSKLNRGNVAPTHPLAQFVGFAAYEAAGGTVLRDLFCDDEAAPGFMTDPALLERLAAQALEREADAVRAEGWQWVEVRTSMTYTEERGYSECRTYDAEPSDEQQARLDALEARIAELGDQGDELDPDSEEAAEVAAQLDEAEAQHFAIQQSLRRIDPLDLPLAGVVVYVDGRGHLAFKRGVMREEDRRARQARDKAAAAQGSGAAEDEALAQGEPPKANFSERLLRQLTAHRTLALRATLAGSPAVALRVLACQLAVQTGLSSRCAASDRPVEVRADTADVRSEGGDLAECKAQQAMDAHCQRWRDLLPRDQRSLLAWVLKADDVQVLDLLAVCTASTLNAVQSREAPQPIADAIADAVDLDMADWWEPTADGYLSAVPKAKIMEAVREGAGATAASGLDGLKKGDLVAQAHQRLQGTRWLPSVLRKAA